MAVWARTYQGGRSPDEFGETRRVHRLEEGAPGCLRHLLLANRMRRLRVSGADGMGMTRSSHGGREVEQQLGNVRDVIGVDWSANLVGCLVFEPLNPACSARALRRILAAKLSTKLSAFDLQWESESHLLASFQPPCVTSKNSQSQSRGHVRHRPHQGDATFCETYCMVRAALTPLLKRATKRQLRQLACSLSARVKVGLDDRCPFRPTLHCVGLV
jgi:hypothetical protein